MKKTILIFFMAFLLMTTNVLGSELKIVSQGAILYDYKTGRVLYGKNENERLPMASTTKIMTLIVALENADISDTVTVSKKASKAPKVKMNLKEGEKIKLEYLLYALMLESSNDSAIAIAEHVFGSVEVFCEEMNKKAIELGAINTNFESPNGLDNGLEHYSTAYDMALISAYALENDEAMKIMRTDKIKFSSDLREYSFKNRNRLLKEYNGANGGKTGFTNKAGQCFVGMAKRDDMQLITVVLASGWGEIGKERKWIDTKILLDYGFNNYNYHTIKTAGKYESSVLNINNSRVEEIPLFYEVEEDIELPLRDDEVENLVIKKEYINEKDAPVEMLEKVGSATILLGEEVIEEMDIVTNGTAHIHDFIAKVENVLDEWLSLGTKEEPHINIRVLIEK